MVRPVIRKGDAVRFDFLVVALCDVSEELQRLIRFLLTVVLYSNYGVCYACICYATYARIIKDKKLS